MKPLYHFNFRHNFAICWDFYNIWSILFKNNLHMLDVNSTQMLIKISPLSFHIRVIRIETASPLSESCSNMSVIHYAPTRTSRCSTHRHLLGVSGTLSLARHSRKNSQQDLSPVSSEGIRQLVWNSVSVHTGSNRLTDVIYVLRHVR